MYMPEYYAEKDREEKMKMDSCAHEWDETYSSQFSNEYETEVYCAKCCTYGSQNNKTKEVYWPVT